jgi:ferredoxin
LLYFLIRDMSTLSEYLEQFSEEDWLAAVDELLPDIHEVDRNAVQIWFRFYPLGLKRYLDGAEDRDEAAKGLVLQGSFDLATQIDTSHHFLYGHRFWPTVKRKIKKMSESRPVGTSAGGQSAERESPSTNWPPAHAGGSDTAGLIDTIKAVACEAARKLGVERSLVNAITAVGLMTLNQVGYEAFAATADAGAPSTPASGHPSSGRRGVARVPGMEETRSPDKVVAERAKDDSQGLFGFLKTIDKKFSVNYSALTHNGRFPIINDEEIVTASQKDHSQNWQEKDPRCWDGPVPIECTSASCGTCWIGVLGGQEKLTPVQRRERRQMKVFGYNQPEDEKPLLRLACQARASGNVTIVIPPWNAVFGKKVYGNVEEVELEPVTTSAKHLRETIASATSNSDE